MSNIEQEITDVRTWDVFDPDGRQVAVAKTPLSARIDEITEDHVIGVFKDDLDVESVRVYRILKR